MAKHERATQISQEKNKVLKEFDVLPVLSYFFIIIRDSRKKLFIYFFNVLPLFVAQTHTNLKFVQRKKWPIFS